MHFKEQLEKDEVILYSGDAHVQKTSRQFLRFLILFLVLLLFWILKIKNIRIEVSPTSQDDLLNLLEYIVLIILSIGLIYGFLYNVFLKYQNRGNQYYVTNKRVAVEHEKKGLEVKEIMDIEDIGISHEKDNYGDVLFSFSSRDFVHKLKNNMEFTGVENPRKIVEIILNLKENIHVYDDHPTWIGKK